MRVVLQRVARASVEIDGAIHSQIEAGLLVLLGIEPTDTQEDAEWLVKKIAALRIFDDEKGVTLVSASSKDKDFSRYGGNVEAAKAIGAAVAKKALEKGITEVVFDRGGYIYHGRVAALAEAAREAGLKF